MKHHCHAVRCTTRCKPEFLMCARHWRLVPDLWQRLVWKHYRHGQCTDKSPSFEWCIAADAAVAAVARKTMQPKPWGSMFTTSFHPERTRDEFLAAYDAMLDEKLKASRT